MKTTRVEDICDICENDVMLTVFDLQDNRLYRGSAGDCIMEAAVREVILLEPGDCSNIIIYVA